MITFNLPELNAGGAKRDACQALPAVGQLWPSDNDDDDDDRNGDDDKDDRNGDETRDHPTMGIQYSHLFTHVFIFILVSLTTRILLK